MTYKTLHPTTADYIFSRARETCPKQDYILAVKQISINRKDNNNIKCVLRLQWNEIKNQQQKEFGELSNMWKLNTALFSI